MRVLVTGATGYVGSRLVPRLLDAGLDAGETDDGSGGFEVVAASRNLASLRRFDWADRVTQVEYDALDADSAVRAVAGCEVVYYLVHGLGEGDFEKTDRDAALNMARAARAAGVSRIVYLGGFTPDGESLSEHLDSRAEVGELLAASGTPTVWLKAAIVLGAGSTSFEVVRYAVERFPVVPAPTWMDSLVQPIAVDDLLYYLVAAADPDRLPPGSYDLGGDERLPYIELIERFSAVAGIRRPILRVPGVPTALASQVLGRLIPVPRALTVDLVDSLNNTMVGEESRIRELIADPPAGLTTLDEAIARSLAGDDRPAGPGHTSDPLQLTDTDERWAGGDVYRTSRTRDVAAPAAQVWAVLEGIGGAQGWAAWPRLGQVGGWVDRFAGGPGRTAEREDPDELTQGDRIASFVVEEVREGFSVRLRTAPHVPGHGTVTVAVDPLDEQGSRLRLDLVYRPGGISGRALWWSYRPVLGAVLGELLRRVATRAERA